MGYSLFVGCLLFLFAGCRTSEPMAGAETLRSIPSAGAGRVAVTGVAAGANAVAVVVASQATTQLGTLRKSRVELDLNGDGRADVCGRGAAGIYCALSNGSAFEGYSLWSHDFTDAQGWTDSSSFETIRFV